MFRMDSIQHNLPQSRIPQAWYNFVPELPKPLAPVLHPGALKPIGPDDLAPLFPMSRILQDVSTDSEIEISRSIHCEYPA
jgi:tryptophan synthase beta chain